MIAIDVTIMVVVSYIPDAPEEAACRYAWGISLYFSPEDKTATFLDRNTEQRHL